MIIISNKILITSALPYVNNVPHLGNIIGCVLSADVFARYCRSSGKECLYICGTDEYGTATETKALEEGVTPKEICDKYYEIHKEIYEWFGISFDKFGRTSTPVHTEITQDIFAHLNKNGFVTEDEIEQLYDEKANMFLADRYVTGTCPYCSYADARGDQCDKCSKLLNPQELINPVSKITKTKPVIKKTKHLFINLPKSEKDLDAWIEKTAKEGFWSQNSYTIAKSWIKEGLKKRSITRDLKWGVPVPVKGFEDKVFYVWFDAPIGYISITANLTTDWKKWWQNPKDVHLYQFMGKDNVAFHTVIFPATLLGTKEPWTMLHHINTTEFLNYEGGKFSKSRGLGVFGNDAVKSGIAPDVFRYYLLANRPETGDSNFTWQEFADRNNSELLANIGNFVNRTLVFVKNNFEGRVPSGNLNDADKEFVRVQKEGHKKITELLEKVKLRDALHEIMGLGKNANKYFQDNKPWELIKTDKKRAETVVGVLVDQVKDLAILLEPYIPNTSKEIFKQLNLPQQKWKSLGTSITIGHAIGEPKPVFRKLEQKEVEELKKKHSGKQVKEINVTYADFDLEVGEIVSIEKHPTAEKLYVEQVKLGDGVRQLVSGLVAYFTPEELLGKKCVILKNLAPAKLRGIESQGMLLVAEKDKNTVEVLSPDVPIGTKVLLQGHASKPKEKITIDEFFAVPITVEKGHVLVDGKELLVQNTKLKTQNVLSGKVC